MGRQAALQQLIATVQRRWAARALRRHGDRAVSAIAVLRTGFTALDAAFRIGGLPRGRLTEVLGTPTSAHPRSDSARAGAGGRRPGRLRRPLAHLRLIGALAE